MKPSRTPSPYASFDPLRHVRLESGHELRTFDTHRTHDGRTCIAYAFSDPSGFVLFAGEDFRGSPMHADDSDATVRALLGFLFLRPGDTDREYFASYTRAQLAFATSDTCELLAFIYSDAAVGTENEGELEDVDDEDAGDIIETTRCALCGRISQGADCCAAPVETVRMRLPSSKRSSAGDGSRVIDGETWSREDFERAHGPHAARARFEGRDGR